TPTNAEVGDHAVVLRVSDGTVNVDQSFTITVANTNDLPIAADDNLNATEDQSIVFSSVTDLLANDSDVNGDALTLAGFTQPINGLLVDNGDGTLTYTPGSDFFGIDSFSYTIDDGNGGTASGMALIVVAPVGDTPQITHVSTNAEVQSGLIFINRNSDDGSEVTHFKITGITNGTLYLSDGTTRIDNGDYITAAQGQAGLRFTPAAGSPAEGSFNVESSEDGVSVSAQSGMATSTITVLTPAPPATVPESSPPPAESEPITEEEVGEEETEVVDEVVDEAGTQAEMDIMSAVVTPQASTAATIAKPSINPSFGYFNQANSDRDDDKTPERSPLLSPNTLKMLVEAKNLGELRAALEKVDITTLNPANYDLMRNSLDAIKEELGQEILISNTILGSAIAASVGLSAGYVVWMLKGGSLLASVLSSLPAWQLADPLAILAGKKEDEDEDGDDESLETIIEESAGRDKDKQSKSSEMDNDDKESTKQ
ncbi:MAG: Ig-like domain-containing protein, partial [Desulfobacterales bacterium]|nr:Ig-like domain-containing protein [Desulfobacterales bacterium]